MATLKTRRKVLIVTASDKFSEYFAGLLPKSDYYPVSRVKSAGEALRLGVQNPPDLMIIDTPLPDEFGIELAKRISEGSTGILLVVKAELLERISFQTEELGIFTVAKPNSKQFYYNAIKVLTAMTYKLQKYETKNKTLQEKMEDIRTVNRAKWLLIEKLNMKEQDAHYLIEKRSMDSRKSRREVAESIIRSYDG